ncbi:MAG: hypothetical protein O3C43_07370 [Verrucomicrobia bacterium]|nr:hypothetical protein [Verrucomicrobiota bacterium]
MVQFPITLHGFKSHRQPAPVGIIIAGGISDFIEQIIHACIAAFDKGQDTFKNFTSKFWANLFGIQLCQHLVQKLTNMILAIICTTAVVSKFQAQFQAL